MRLSLRFLAPAALAALLAGLLLAGGPADAAEPADPARVWYSVDADGEVTVDLYFVWSETCPHCREAKPFIEALPVEYAWIRLHSVSIAERDAVAVAEQAADEVGEEITAVPAFLWCGRLEMGYGSAETTGRELLADLEACREALAAAVAEAPPGELPPISVAAADGGTVDVPVFGDVSADAVSLPTLAIVLGGLDAFNPCAFFVLLTLLSLLVHARSRARMAIIGGIFVLVSGVAYFAFMVAWLNVFLVAGPLRWVTVVAGVVAVAIAAVNIKDYVWARRGFSLSIPESAKPRLFQRMRGLTAGSRYPALIVGAVTLAIAANTYELLCTAGFPMVFTRVLSLNDLPTAEYYGYVLLYNVVYVLPLLAIVTGFVWTLGSRKVSEQEGRTLKLLSGMMMLGLGTVMLLAPDLLTRLGTAVVILAAALAVTLLIVVVDRRLLRHRHLPA